MVDYIKSYLGSSTTPGQAGNMFWASVYILLIFLGLSVAVIAMNCLERKILAHMLQIGQQHVLLVLKVNVTFSKPIGTQLIHSDRLCAMI